MRKFKCAICGYVYGEAAGIPEKGIPPGTKWESLPDGFLCPVCGAPKSVFKQLEEAVRDSEPGSASAPTPEIKEAIHIESIRELSAGEVSAICSSLAKGCEKQRLAAETEAFYKLADYFKAKTDSEGNPSLSGAAAMLDIDLAEGFEAANSAAKNHADRGAQRSLVWSGKVSAMLKSLLERFQKEGDAMLENTGIYVCDICGFVYLGDAPPEVCPVCKVPSFKITRVERR